MENYFAVKRRFIDGEIGTGPKKLVLNVDDAYGRRLADEHKEESTITFGASKQARLRATDIELAPDGATFTLEWDGKRYLVNSPLIGLYNVSNTLAALSMAVLEDVPVEKCIGSLNSFGGIPGRMERVSTGQPFEVVVDYAHTGNALENALKMLQEITPGKVKVVFGCGGDRDRGKRVEMTKVSTELADYCWATTDNPRSEVQEQIFDDMREGISGHSKIEFVLDRRRAIELALKSADPGDCVLIAGKGHEPFQEYGDTVVPFDDRKVARELLESMKLGGRI